MLYAVSIITTSKKTIKQIENIGQIAPAGCLLIITGLYTLKGTKMTISKRDIRFGK